MPPVRLVLTVISAWLVLACGIFLVALNSLLALGIIPSGTSGTKHIPVVLIGVVAAIIGGRRTIATRGLLHRDVVLRLDAEGVAMRCGMVRDVTWARLAWSDLDSVEVRKRRIGPPVYRDNLDATVLRFVARDDSAVRIDELTPFDRAKAAVLDLSPAAGTLAMVLAAATHERVEQVRAWLAEQQPDVPFDRQPA